MFLLAAALALTPAQTTTLSPTDAGLIGKEAVAVLTRYSKDGDAEARALVAAAWGQIGNKAVAPMLRKALKDKNISVRIEAATSLNKLGDTEAARATLEAVILKGSAAPAGLTPQEEMRRLSRDKARAKAIARLSEFGGEDAVRLFEQTLTDVSPAVREATSLALARMGLDEFADPFLSALQDKDENVRAAAVRALGEIGRTEYLPAVKEAAGDPAANVRLEAMGALARFEGVAGAPMLAQGLNDEDARVRAKALWGLAKIPDPDTKDALKALFRETNVPEAALKAQAGLAVRGEPVDTGLADRTLQGKDLDMRALALEALREAPGDEASLLLNRTMNEDSEPRLRIAAATALVKRLQRRRGS